MKWSGLKYLVVGAGLWGGVIAERIASVLGEPVVVLERRKHTGGNCHSFVDRRTGIECHAYGTHVFHTGIQRVWEYINRFAHFTSYRHKVLTEYRGRIYQMPISLPTINSFYGLNLRPYEVEDFILREAGGASPAAPCGQPANLEEKAVSLVGRPLYEAFIKGYTQKQWGRDPRDLPAEIINRLPVRANYNTDYFSDPWQGMPESGYAGLFEALLRHPKIQVELGVSWKDVADQVPASCRIFYSGPLDEFFDYALGALEWRGLRFENRLEPYRDVQGTAVLNQADGDVPFTRTHEYKHLHPERGAQGEQSILTREYPRAFSRGDEPYYPVNTPENERLMGLYRERLASGHPNMIAGGRLGGFRYMDMDKTIDFALSVFAGL
ncbi:MAG: NAD(P)-binding protein [Desulfovibrio sp.]|jgi:UDP-galactopyranose mutase|nr:NAD(P)-binding protein [Desulfovibrio sp.]